MSLPVTADHLAYALSSIAKMKEAFTDGTKGAEILPAVVTHGQYKDAQTAIESGLKLNTLATIQAAAPWVLLTDFLSSSWVSFSKSTEPQYRWEPGNTIVLRGAIKSGSLPGSAITLPFQLKRGVTLPVCSNGAFGQISISLDGLLSVDVGSVTSVWLDGVRFSLD